MSTGSIVMLVVGLAVIAWAWRCIASARSLHPGTRVVAACTFIPIALACMWGFAAAMEPGDYHVVWRVGYAVVFVISVFTAGWLVLIKRAPEFDDAAAVTSNHTDRGN